MFVTGLVLAAGGSRRLGRPKQLLPYRGRTLLDATLSVARECRFDQLLVTLGGSADEVRASVDLQGAQVVESAEFTAGCGTSISAALEDVDQRSDGAVLMLGDQPGVTAESVRRLIAAGADAPIAVCRYLDGVGHPFWFRRELFDELRALHGDKAVWKLIESTRWPVTEVPRDDAVPLDVDTWEDYEALLLTRALTKGARS
jgi:molybdenum cofactor cytidylyltransferase